MKNLVSLRDVRTIDFLTNRVSTGSVFLSDVTATRASIGRTGQITLPRLSTNDVTVQEGDSGRRVLRFRINLSRPVHRQVRVHVDAANDFFGDPALTPVSRTLVYEPGQTTKTVAVTVNADTFDNPDRVFSVVLSIPKEAILDRSIATGTVVDDDEAPTISIGAATATEHEGVVKFPLTLSRPAADIVFVDAQINEFTARFGSDIASGNEMFGLVEAGQTHGELDVAIVDDNVPEPTEAFQVHVLATGGADLTGPENVVGTILDDD